MNSPLVKLCGLFRSDDIEVANRLHPDFVGFMFAVSPRHITHEQAAHQRDLLDPLIPAVGVFRNQPASEIRQLASAGTIQVIQLHGDESNQDIQDLRQATGLPVWKAFHVRTAADVDAVNASSADLVLVDSGGGTGTTFDWSLLKRVRRPYLLAGGLTSLNVEGAVRELRPFGVDVSSGIETDGLKDPEKMKDFTNKARNAASVVKESND